ncbi:MAG: hypothetical protein HY895_23360 [Deltaproteobacteria bacterium]|nr:hypothetical protein [Deltaproteobacteria bacterium]
MAIHRFTAPTIAFLILVGCASIPSEAPTLSQELGNRISAIEKANITLLRKFFNQKRDQVDRFVEEEWVPTFAREFFDNPKVSAAWDTIVRENDKVERLKFIVLLGPKLQSRINSKRVEYIRPLDDLEREIESRLRFEYNQARSINNTITSFLLSASKIDENRKKYLAMMGVKDDQISMVIDRTDEICSDLVSKANEAKDKLKTGQAFIEKIRELKSNL